MIVHNDPGDENDWLERQLRLQLWEKNGEDNDSRLSGSGQSDPEGFEEES